MNRNTSIDIGLAALTDNARHGQTLSAEHIADVCNCTKNYIYELEKKGIAKLRKNKVLMAYHSEQ
ncbi:MAG: hypothetical protein ACTSY1_02330 [Alphaproteobacteria bacterium]